LLARFACSEPLTIGNTSELEKIIIGCFQKSIVRPTDDKRSKINCSLSLMFETDNFGKEGFTISPNNIYDFNKIIEALFRREIGISIGYAKLYSNPEMKTVVLNFLDSLGISEDEIAYDTIKKHFDNDRHRQDMVVLDCEYVSKYKKICRATT